MGDNAAAAARERRADITRAAAFPQKLILLLRFLAQLTGLTRHGAKLWRHFFCLRHLPAMSIKLRTSRIAREQDLIDDSLRLAADVDAAAAAGVRVLADVARLPQNVVEGGDFELGHVGGVLGAAASRALLLVTRRIQRYLQRDDVGPREGLRGQQVGEVPRFDVEFVHRVPRVPAPHAAVNAQKTLRCRRASHVSAGGDGYNVRVPRELFERDWAVHAATGISVVV